MNTTKPDTCHCIVRHPDKPKFLVVRHDDTWSPPVLMFPPGLVDFKVNQINQGMRDKYGLKTRVLRPVVHLPNYHCVEMELASTEPARKLQAVWVDEAEYLRTRSAAQSGPDPFELWFREQASGSLPPRRPPFHRPGWFDQAEHWIQFQLDQLGIQVTGSVEQFRQGWTSSCLLRVPTNQGWVYFKAGNELPPGEAALTEALAERWPDTVARPLAVDARRNWMLNRDLRAGQAEFDLQQLPEFAGQLARLQLDSHDELSRWKNLGCREVSLETLAQVCRDASPHRAVLQEGGGGLDDTEWSRLQQALQPIIDDCGVLVDTGLPLTLVHADFRDDNLAMLDGKPRLLDWSGTIISHPFLALGRIFQARRSNVGRGGASGSARISDELHRRIIESYLQPFHVLAGRDELQRALVAAERVERFWVILRMIFQLETIEPATPHYYRQVVNLQIRARRFSNLPVS